MRALVAVALALAACASEAPSTTDRGDAGGPERDAGARVRDAGAPATDAEVDGGALAPDAGTRELVATNPILGTDRPDPHVMRVEGPDGPTYYLVHTVHNGGDIPILKSRDLVNWEDAGTVFQRARTPGRTLDLNGGHFCSVWAPELVQVRDGVFMVNFSAQRYASARDCGGYLEDGGVYVASSASPEGPYAVAARPWEPLAVGGHVTDCPADVKASIPHSLETTSGDCQGGYCHHIVRLDGSAWRDPATGRWWLGYSWYTNTPPRVDWERGNYGQHVSLVELDGADPFTVRCDTSVAQLHIGNPHDAATRAALASYCDRCGERLEFTRGRFDENIVRDGYSWGVVEGVSLFRRGDWVYALLSGSVWDSGYYHVFFVAARSVEGLALGSGDRIVGRYLIPSESQAFGHGTAVLGPDDESWYFVHHRLDHPRCRDAGDCSRDVWLSPIEFEDRGDGRGDVWIRPRFPAEEPEVRVLLRP